MAPVRSPMKRQAAKREGHPAERFVAPAAIQQGTPLADLVGRRSIALLAESIAAVERNFDAQAFTRQALRGLEHLGLMQRGAAVGKALRAHLPDDVAAALAVLVSSLGPELQATEGNGLAPFFYLPHSFVIAESGIECFDRGIQACHELTRRFTAEFCIRPYLVQHREKTLRRLRAWTGDANPHVRRLVSEGTRPRLPWGMRLKTFQEDPSPTLALLEKLKDDPERYVQRSVANHLGDILKDNPVAAYETCERWIEEVSSPKTDGQRAQRRRWIVSHAVRLPARQGHKRALRLRQLANQR